MRHRTEILTRIRAAKGRVLEDAGIDWLSCLLPGHKNGRSLNCVAAWRGGWDRVRVLTAQPGAPTWADMCIVKDVFFGENETVIQVHPPDTHPAHLKRSAVRLVLWRPQMGGIPLPPATVA